MLPEKKIVSQRNHFPLYRIFYKTNKQSENEKGSVLYNDGVHVQLFIRL